MGKLKEVNQTLEIVLHFWISYDNSYGQLN